MQIKSTSVRRVMGLAALVAAVAGTSIANAQQSDDNVKGSFDQPLSGGKGGAARSSSSTMMMSESDGEHTYSVKIQGDKVTGEVDGQAIPSKRIRKRDGRVEILDESGEVLKSFNVRTVTGGPLAPAAPRFYIENLPGGQNRALAGTPKMWDNPPKVMVGVTMTDTDDGGAHIDSVKEGLPADEAGLKVGDRVIKCNGKDVDDVESWREMIREGNPGDTMNLVVDREGKEVELKLKLAAFDRDKMSTMMQPQGWAQMNTGDHGLQAARESIEQALKTLKDNKEVSGKALESACGALEKALEKLDDVKAHTALTLDDQLRVFGQGGQNFVLPTPATPLHTVNTDMARQLEKMNAQMEKLNRRLEELEKNKR